MSTAWRRSGLKGRASAARRNGVSSSVSRRTDRLSSVGTTGFPPPTLPSCVWRAEKERGRLWAGAASTAIGSYPTRTAACCFVSTTRCFPPNRVYFAPDGRHVVLDCERDGLRALRAVAIKLSPEEADLLRA